MLRFYSIAVSVVNYIESNRFKYHIKQVFATIFKTKETIHYLSTTKVLKTKLYYIAILYDIFISPDAVTMRISEFSFLSFVLSGLETNAGMYAIAKALKTLI